MSAGQKTDPLWSVPLGYNNYNPDWTIYDTATRTKLDAGYDHPGSIKEVCFEAGNQKTYIIDFNVGAGAWDKPKLSKFTHWYDGVSGYLSVNKILQVDVNDNELQRPLRRVVDIDGNVNYQIWDYTVPAGQTDDWLQDTAANPGAWSNLKQPQWQPPAWTYSTLHDRLEMIYQSKQSHLCVAQWRGNQLWHYNIELLNTADAQASMVEPYLSIGSSHCSTPVILGKQWQSKEDHRERPICKVAHTISQQTTLSGNVAIIPVAPSSPSAAAKGIKEFNVIMQPKSQCNVGTHTQYSFDTRRATQVLIDYFEKDIKNGDSRVVNEDVTSPRYFWHGTHALKDPSQNLNLESDKGPYLWTVIMTPYSHSLQWAFKYTNAHQLYEKTLDDVNFYAGFIAVLKSNANSVGTDTNSNDCVVAFDSTIGYALTKTDAQVYGRMGYGMVNVLNRNIVYNLPYPPQHPDAYIFPAAAQKKCKLKIDSIFYLKPVKSGAAATNMHMDPTQGVKATKGGDPVVKPGYGRGRRFAATPDDAQRRRMLRSIIDQ